MILFDTENFPFMPSDKYITTKCYDMLNQNNSILVCDEGENEIIFFSMRSRGYILRSKVKGFNAGECHYDLS
jgi:hypothetical protein